MSNALPLILAGGAALLLLSGKKKKKKDAPAANVDEPDAEDGGPDPDDEDIDEGDGPDPDPDDEDASYDQGYGIVASGSRNDRLGQHAWRIRFEPEGYLSQITASNHWTAPVVEEVGVSASLSAAKRLLSDRFNELMLDSYPDESPKNDPMGIMLTRSTV